jgi:hypothetical protein
MTGAPKVKTVPGVSDFGYSYVYGIFEDGTDLYWGRSPALEYLSSVQSRLPEGVKTELGPDATALGWVYQYAQVDTSGKRSLADLRSYQDSVLALLSACAAGRGGSGSGWRVAPTGSPARTWRRRHSQSGIRRPSKRLRHPATRTVVRSNAPLTLDWRIESARQLPNDGHYGNPAAKWPQITAQGASPGKPRGMGASPERAEESFWLRPPDLINSKRI